MNIETVSKLADLGAWIAIMVIGSAFIVPTLMGTEPLIEFELTVVLILTNMTTLVLE